MKKIELKPLLVSIGLVVFQTICFFISKLFESNPTLIGGVIDSKIPFKVIFIIPYCIWYIMLFLIPYYLYKKNKNIFSKFVLSYILCVLIAMIIFITFPTTVARPDIIGNNIIELIAKLIFYFDTPILNCFPSLHCAISMLFLLFIIYYKEGKTHIKLFTIIMSILIMLSTLFVKQHVFIDLISGDILATIVFIISILDKKLTNKITKLLK